MMQSFTYPCKYAAFLKLTFTNLMSEKSILLGYYTVSLRNWIRTFQGNSVFIFKGQMSIPHSDPGKLRHHVASKSRDFIPEHFGLGL